MQPEEHVLTTLERDGSRKWLFPRLSTGVYWQLRRIVAYVLIAFFVALPHLRINGKPAILLDITHRKFVLFGTTFLATDTMLLALFMVSVFLTVFLATALLGRIWCGWGCPQTVYMEFVYRPIERLFMGTTGRGGQPRKAVAGWRHAAMYATFLLISAGLAHTFLAYFVGTEALAQWMQMSPFQHPGPFLVMAVTTAAMMFDFSFFREQMCLIACPYGRFQSVLLDSQSLIVAYDHRRGEPRGKATAKAAAKTTQLSRSTVAEPPADRLLPVVNEPSTQSAETSRGDCVDCDACVRTCPTGIDIRDGLQMECLHCTQCMDACDTIMDRLKRPRGLIRYSSQSAIDGNAKKGLRPRLVIYPALLTLALAALTFSVATKKSFDVTVLRNFGQPFVINAEGQVSNSFRLKLVNRLETPDEFTVSVLSPKSVSLEFTNPVSLKAEQTETLGLQASVGRDQFQRGEVAVQLEVKSKLGDRRVVTCTLMGP